MNNLPNSTAVWSRVCGALGLVAAMTCVSTRALADDPMGAPPADTKALVDAPKVAAAAPKTETPTNETTASVSAGGQLATGNSRLMASTATGKVELRRDANGFGASVLANYGEGASPGNALVRTTENAQLRARYDRYLVDQMSLFLIGTGRHDYFQGVDFRLNIDPGAKYIFLLSEPTVLWGEAGYDFAYDIRNDDARRGTDAKSGKPNDASFPFVVDKTATDHSARLFLGARHSFNKEVTVSGGLEYLQSIADTEKSRLNFDALLAANIGGGLALGVGYSARYDHKPLSGKKDLDTVTTVSLIYAFHEIATPPAPPPPPAAAPAVAAPSAPPPTATPPVAPSSAPAPVPPPAPSAPSKI